MKADRFLGSKIEHFRHGFRCIKVQVHLPVTSRAEAVGELQVWDYTFICALW